MYTAFTLCIFFTLIAAAWSVSIEAQVVPNYEQIGYLIHSYPDQNKAFAE